MYNYVGEDYLVEVERRTQSIHSEILIASKMLRMLVVKNPNVLYVYGKIQVAKREGLRLLV